MATEYQTMRLEIEAGLATVLLDRPDAFNTINIQMGEDLQSAIQQCADNDHVRVVVLTGAGKSFSGGGDIRAFHAAMETDIEAHLLHVTKAAHDAVLAMRALPKPIIASINGVIAGGALGFALACDLRIASDAAKFTTAYLNIGASPDCGNTYFLTRALGLFKATELLLLPDTFDATEALRVGLVHRVVPAAELAQRTTELAVRLASGPTEAIGRTKHLLNRAMDSDLADQLNAEGWSISACGGTQDFREGLGAFLAKRPAAFVGR